MRRQNNYPAVGAVGPKIRKNVFRKNLTLSKIVGHCRKPTQNSEHPTLS